FGHLAAADAGEAQRHAGALLQRAHQRAAEPVAGFLHRDEKDFELAVAALRRLRIPISGCRAVFGRTVGGAHGAVAFGTAAPAASTPVTNSLARSATLAINSGSATMVEPATTATPASPAAAAPSMVCGPMVGRSMRWSW